MESKLLVDGCAARAGVLLRNNDASPAIFHSIGEAKEALGHNIAPHLQLIFSGTYDEMFHPEEQNKP